MKNSRYILLLITVAFFAFTLGMFLGRSHYDGSISVLVDQKSPTSGKIDLNNGTIDELCLLPGISEIMAQRIVDYRQKNGPFRSVEELCNVSGISKDRLKELRNYITVE